MNNTPRTLITVPLNNLYPFDMNPRLVRNPDYNEIKESIRSRGLDHPPSVTQRPGESFYIIASGGNTRLAILNDLWQETHDDKYRNVTCIYHPWQSKKSLAEGNLHCLLGHLIENEMRGSLTFIERALGVQHAKELYQHTNSGSLSQTQLARQLCHDGFPVTQSSISRMESAIELLLPHIPDVLYGGLSRTVVEKILLLRNSTEQFWFQQSANRDDLPLFADIFALALLPFNGPLVGFSLEHLRDELTGLISQALEIDYNTVALITDSRNMKRQHLLGIAPPTIPALAQQRTRPPTPTIQSETARTSPSPGEDNVNKEGTEDSVVTSEFSDIPDPTLPAAEDNQTVGAASTAHHSPTGPDTIWDIDPLTDTPEYLATVADQLAWELAATAGLAYLISPSVINGFELASPETKIFGDARLMFQLLSFVAGKASDFPAIWHQLLIGSPGQPALLNDTTMIPLFRLIRTLRRLHEKQQEGATP